MKKTYLLLLTAFVVSTAFSQDIKNNPASNHGNDFEQLGTILTTPNEYRTASGAPGPKYWQQRADYDIKASLDEVALKLTGTETITYYNNSPDVLNYIWMQLDENQHSSVNNANYQNSSNIPAITSIQQLNSLKTDTTDNGYGDIITKITDASGKPLEHTINKTMMRVDLPTTLKPGQKFVFNVQWYYKISDRMSMGGRGGYEYFPEDGNYLFTMTQWYPRLCVYSDFLGWQNHQFTGRGEFALTFGTFRVQMTVPADHIVGATGQCQNYAEVLTPTQKSRWQKAQSVTEPLKIVTLDEAKAAEKNKSKFTKTWIFKADSVRDFAWTSSRKFIWDAMPIDVEGRRVMCMSYYGKEAYGLYSRYSTKVVAHTVKTYSSFTFPFPYPVAQSVEAANGMEYPMICFNFGRTNKDGTYSENTKYGMLGVIIHEVGHNFFPMIVNSDERQWTWMDEGLNTFVEYLTEELFDNKFPTRRGPAWTIADYMKLPKDQLEPIMTNSEDIVGFGPNAYSKPSTGLNILRETIMGRELFDYAFKQYARRWEFKHPTPADFFRTMQDASGEDLNWFWRGWFYGIDPCDISLDSVKVLKADAPNQLPAGMRDSVMMRSVDKPASATLYDDVSKIRNRQNPRIKFASDQDTALQDFYYRYNRNLEPYDTAKYSVPQLAVREPLADSDRASLQHKFFYELHFSNKGGMVMPIIIQWTYKDSTKEIERIPAQIWRLNEKTVVKAFMKDKEVASIRIDPNRETADINESNNTWGDVKPELTRFQVFKLKQQARGQAAGPNPMQKGKMSN